jgi:hypothetical protein
LPPALGLLALNAKPRPTWRLAIRADGPLHQ